MVKEIKDVINLLSNTKIRAIFIVVLVAIAIAVTVGYIHLKRTSTTGAPAGAQIATAGQGITSVPTVGKEPPREYVKLQEKANVTEATQALKAQTAFIPTPIRATYLETGTAGAPGKGGECSAEELRKARDSGVTAAELRCKGCSLEALKAAGFTAGELRNAGFTAQELKAAGFSALDLKNAGFSAKELKDAGFGVNDLKNLGFTAGELKNAGFSATDLKNAGFSAKDLRDAGFTAQQLKNAGFTANELKDAGATAAELMEAGYSDSDLANAGFTNDEIKNAKNALLHASDNCSVNNLRKLRANGANAQTIKTFACSANDLAAAGFTAAELKDLGFTAKQLKDAGFSAADLRKLGFSAKELANAGFNAKDLKNAGFSAAELKNAGFSAGALKDAGFGAKDLIDAGYSIDSLKKAGFSAADLKNAGASLQDLKNAGFTDGDLLRAGFEKKDLGLPAAVTPPQTKEAAAPPQGGVASTQQNVVFVKEAVAAPSVSSASISLPQVPLTSEDELLAQLDQMRAIQGKTISSQEYQARSKQIQQTMTTQANDLFASWIPLPSQQLVQGTQATAGTSQQGAQTATAQQGASGTKGATPPGSVIKAGTVMFGVLDTGINSDEKSPIMATVVEGDLKGSKLLGDFDRSGKKVVIRFHTLNKPDLATTMPINAVAIDPNTARTAMATDVDNHYMMKYGVTFAASFIGGIGQSFQDSGNSVQINTSTGENVNFNASTNVAKAAVVGLGVAGNRLANELQPLANTPPTVVVKSGSGIGILLMSDLTIPLK